MAALLLLGLFLLPAAQAKPLMGQALDKLASGDVDGAVELYLSVPQPGPEGDDGRFVQSRMQVAKLRFAAKDYEGAIDACEAVLAVYPENIEALKYRESVRQKMLPEWQRFLKDTVRFMPMLLKGSLMTLMLVVCTMLISPVGGLLIALGRISTVRPLSRLCWFIIWIFRGTPLLLQLFFIYYGLPALGITLKPLPSALIGLGLNYSAYLAEIIRGGIQSIDEGQTEAAKALGMSHWETMHRVIIPQTYKRLIPPIGNEFIALIKDTALVSTIAMVELMRTADQLFNASFNVTVLILAAVIYLVYTSFFTFLFERVEARVGAYENRS